MHLTTYENAADFLGDVRGYLEQQEVVNGLMLGLAIRLVREPLAYGSPPYFAMVAEDGRPIQAALMTPPYNLILYSDREAADADALALVASDLAAHGWPVPGVIGPLPLTQAFSDIWTLRAAVRPVRGRGSRIYELRTVILPRIGAGHLRVATVEDRALAVAWWDAFRSESMANTPDQDAAREVSQRMADEALFLWDDGGPACRAGKNRPTQHGITIGPVYTPPPLRRRGYATSCMAALSQRLLDSGYEYCTLFTDLANPTSNDIYQQIGYRPVCDFQEIRFV